MRCHYLFAILCLFRCLSSYAQQSSIKGTIIDENGKKVYNANVFINGTNAGTRTDINGTFELQNIPGGQHELIISCIGYETNVFSFFEEQLPLQIKVELLIKAKELQNVTISTEAYKSGGWAEYGEIFQSNFIGFLENAKKCRIKNTNTLHFRFYPASKRLVAYADEPLEIENAALGYLIFYQLEGFEANTEKGTTFYKGYSLFSELDARANGVSKKYEKAREETYNGSIMHFMRSLYHDKLGDAGFEVRKIIKTLNAEKQRISLICKGNTVFRTFPNGLKVLESVNGKPALSRDSLYLYQKILEQPDTLELPEKVILTADEIITMNNEGNPVLKFNDRLMISFLKTFFAHVEVPRQKPQNLVSFLTLAPGAAVGIDEDGYFYDSEDVFTSGYWGLSERISNLLPQDFKVMSISTASILPTDPFPPMLKPSTLPALNSFPKNLKLNEHAIVRDSTGILYPYFLWQPMVASGNYTLVPKDSTDKNTSYLLHRKQQGRSRNFTAAYETVEKQVFQHRIKVWLAEPYRHPWE